MDGKRLAILLMIFQAVFFAAETAIIHHLGPSVPVMQLAFIRGAAGLVLAFVVARALGLGVLCARRPVLQLVRGGVSLLYMWVMIYSFSHLPFADATAISYTQAAYIAAFSMLILGERITWLGWGAVLLGIGGALLICKPALSGWNLTYLVVLIGTALNGLAFVLNRYLQRDDGEATTMFCTSMVLVLGNAPALGTASLPATEIIIWLSGILVFGPIGMYVGIVAVRHASAGTLGPYTLLRLLIGLIGGIVFFRELPDAFSALGAIMILLSCVVSASASSHRTTKCGAGHCLTNAEIARDVFARGPGR